MNYSDDDIIDISSGEENDYSDDDGEDLRLAKEDEINDDDNYELAELVMKRSQETYVVLKEKDIRKQQRDDIERVSTVLSLSRAEAIVVLLHYHWSVDKVQDEWFTDEERIRKTIGILKEPVVDLNNRKVSIECGICFDSYTRKEIAKVSCGHPYCITCWTSYITTQIKDGPGCLRVKCPEPSCSAAVGQDMIDLVIKKTSYRKKYYRYFLRSYVEDGKKIKWCPSPGCEYAIDFGVGSGIGSSYDVSCLCSHSFCWNCTEDAHRPVDCDTVSKWIFKNKDESENTNWILAMTKPCPKCKRPIEKNQGCSHMRCSPPCSFYFCWLCLVDLKDHQTCHRFKEDEATIKRERAKNAIDRYTHYYERWAFNQSSRLKAMKDLEKWQSGQLKKLTEKQKTSETQLQFTVDAWLQIIECRRVLKWTYAYGYYLPNHEQAKREFFEYLQGEAESVLERLHYCAEKELAQFILKSEDSPTIFEFDGFRMKLTGLTTVTKTYFENLVKALENGLADVSCIEATSTTTSKNCTLKRKILPTGISSSKRQQK